MTMTDLLTLFGYGAAVVATVVLSYFVMGWRHPSFRMACMMAVLWILALLTDAWMDPWMDAIGFYAALLTWWSAEFDRPMVGRNRQAVGNRWVLVLSGIFLAQQVVHFSFPDPESFWRQAALNVLFLVALMTIGFPSVSRAIQPFGPRRRHRGSSRRSSAMARIKES